MQLSKNNLKFQKGTEKILSLPVKFEDDNINNVLDNEMFFKIKLYYATIGKNLNSSSISKEVYEDAKSTLEFKPILAYMQNTKLENGDEQPDFTTHAIDCVPVIDEDGELIAMKQKYLEQPVGFIPPNYMNNYHYELDEQNGLTYAVVDAYIYTIYCQDAVDVLIKNQKQNISMEVRILDDTYDFQTNTLNINKMKYLGITILSNLVDPGMQQARAEVGNYSLNLENDKYCKMLEAFQLSYAKLTETKEINKDNNIEKNNLKDDEVKVDMAEKKVVEPIVPEVKELDNEKLAKAVVPEVKKPDDTTAGEVIDKETPKDVSKSAKKVPAKIAKEDMGEPDGDEKIICNEEPDGDESKKMSLETVKADYEKKLADFGKVVLEKDEAMTALSVKYDKVVAEFEVIKGKYEKIEKDSKEVEIAKVFAKFSTKLAEADMKEIKESVADFSISEIEDKLFALVGKKALLDVNFSASIEQNMDKKFNIAVETPIKEDKTNEKSYAALVKKYSKK